MVKFLRVMTILLLSIQWASAATYIAIMETIVQSDAISISEKDYLTDELRKQASQVLSSKYFTIMTSDNIRMLLSDGKELEDCIGSCVVETGKNLEADFITNTKVSPMDGQLALTIELYNVRNKKLIGSYTTLNHSAEGLLEDIEQNATELFENVIRESGLNIKKKEGIFNVKVGKTSMGEPFVNRYLIDLTSSPTGAIVLVDQSNEDHCITPCQVEVDEGKHHFQLSKELYTPLDTTLSIKGSRNINLEMDGNFGTLIFDPQIGPYSSQSDIFVTLDGTPVTQKQLMVETGTHYIVFHHRCYETKKMKVEVTKKTKTLSPNLIPAKGTLDARTLTKKKIALYHNGEFLSYLPFRGSVDVCGKIGLEQPDNILNLNLTGNEVTTYIHKTTFTDYDSGKEYSFVKIGDQTWTAESIERYGTKEFTHSQALEVCPDGWKIPSTKDFQTLNDYVGANASYKLRSKEGWGLPNWNGADLYGFSAKPNEERYWAQDGYCYIGLGTANIMCSQQFWDSEKGLLDKMFHADQAEKRYVRCIKSNDYDERQITSTFRKPNLLTLGAFTGINVIANDTLNEAYQIPLGGFATVYFPMGLQLTLGISYNFVISHSEESDYSNYTGGYSQSYGSYYDDYYGDYYDSYYDEDDYYYDYYSKKKKTTYDLNKNLLSFTLKAGFVDDRHWLKLGFQMEKNGDLPMLYGGYVQLGYYTLFGEISILGNKDLIKGAWTYSMDLFHLPW